MWVNSQHRKQQQKEPDHICHVESMHGKDFGIFYLYLSSLRQKCHLLSAFKIGKHRGKMFPSQAGLQSQEIMTVSGHRCENDMRSYMVLTISEREKKSKILSCNPDRSNTVYTFQL